MATTCFSITFEKSPQAYPKQDITIRLWLRAADSGWELRLYEDDMAKLLDQNEEPLAPIKDQFVDEIGFVLKALTLWPPSTEPKKAIGFRSDRVDGAGA